MERETDPAAEDRRRRVAALRTVHERGGLGGLVAYCERLLAGALPPVFVPGEQDRTDRD